jgi:putative flippase GtrA
MTDKSTRNAISALLANSRFARFLLAGGLAASANLSSRILFSQLFSFPVAVVLAFFVGLSTGYLLSRHLVFDPSSNPRHLEMGYYILINLFALLQTALVSIYVAAWLQSLLDLQVAQALAHLLGVMVPAISSYFGHKYLTFKQTAADDIQ